MGSHLLLVAAALAGLASASACRHEQGPPPEPDQRIVDAASLRAAMQSGAVATDPLFWRVESAGGATLFLLGSIHFGPASGWQQPQDIDAAFERAAVVVVEVDQRGLTPAEMQAITARYALLPAGETLEDHLSEQTLERLRAYLNQRGAALEAMSSLQPWMIANVISIDSITQLGFSFETGIDIAYLARVNEQEVIELESAASQLALMASMAPDVQELGLLDALDEAERAEEVVMDLALAWERGRKHDLVTLVNAPFERNPAFAPFREAILIGRNREMSLRLDDLAHDPERAGQDVFVIVGAAHLVGDDSIIELLREHGLVVAVLRPSRESDTLRTNREVGQ